MCSVNDRQVRTEAGMLSIPAATPPAAYSWFGWDHLVGTVHLRNTREVLKG